MRCWRRTLWALPLTGALLVWGCEEDGLGEDEAAEQVPEEEALGEGDDYLGVEGDQAFGADLPGEADIEGEEAEGQLRPVPDSLAEDEPLADQPE